MSSASHPLHVDAVEQHGQLGGVHLDRAAIVGEAWRSKSAALEPLVVNDQASAVPKQDLAAVTTTPQEDEQMPGEEVHSPLSTNDAAQTVMPAAKINGLNRKIDPNARRKRQHLLTQPVDERRHVGQVAAFFEANLKAGLQLNLNLLRNGAAEPDRQKRQSIALRAGAPRRLVELIPESRVGHAVLGGYLREWNRSFSRLGDDGRPKLSSVD